MDKKDVKIMVSNRGKYKDLSVRFLIKCGDYTLEEYEELCDQVMAGAVGRLRWDTDEEVMQKPPEKDTFFEDFRMTVVREFGEQAYIKIKQRLGFEHLRDIPGTPGEVRHILAEELYNLRKESGFYDQ